MSTPALSPVNLQPPGAGLPAFELAYLRLAFRFACIVTSQNAAMRQFKREGEKIVALARSVSAAQGTVRVLINRIAGIEDGSRYWSVYMVLEHLRIVDEGIIRIIDELTNDRPFAREVRIQDAKPSIDSGPGAVDRFVTSVAAYEATVNRLGKLGRRARHPHPWFGPMTAHDWHCLAGIHHGLHCRQIERINRVSNTQVVMIKLALCQG
jgi:hypothetical protein